MKTNKIIGIETEMIQQSTQNITCLNELLIKIYVINHDSRFAIIKKIWSPIELHSWPLHKQLKQQNGFHAYSVTEKCKLGLQIR